MEKVGTTCRGCNRAVWSTDVNKDGKCILCVPVKAVTKPVVVTLETVIDGRTMKG